MVGKLTVIYGLALAFSTLIIALIALMSLLYRNTARAVLAVTVLVQLMYFAFGILLVTVVGIVIDWVRKGRLYVAQSRFNYVFGFVFYLLAGLGITVIWNVIRVVLTLALRYLRIVT